MSKVHRLVKTIDPLPGMPRGGVMYDYDGFPTIVSELDLPPVMLFVSMSDAPISGIRRERFPTETDIRDAAEEFVPGAAEKEWVVVDRGGGRPLYMLEVVGNIPADLLKLLVEFL